MRRGHRIAVIALACLGVVGGTVGWMATLAAGEPGTAKPAEPKASDSKAADSKAAAPAPSPPPVVKLLDPGRDPKRPFRLKAARGTEEDLVMTMKTESSVTTGGTPVNNPSAPPIRMTMRTKVTDVASGGDMTYEFVYTKCEVLDADQVAAPQTQMLKGMLTSLEGLKGTAVVSELGIMRDMKLEKKEGMNPMLSQLLGGMTNAIQSIPAPSPRRPWASGRGGRSPRSPS